jgi:hypothetical protein
LSEAPLNYFNYFTEIEDAFVRRRGKHLYLSPMDWALIESWKQMNIPLHVVLRGVERAFDSWESKPRKRTVKSLLYCQEEVEAQFAEWLEARVGSEEQVEEAPASDAMPFSRAAILDHLERAHSQLKQLATNRPAQNELREALLRSVSLLEELQKDFADTANPNAQKLEISLTGIERMLSDAIQSVAAADKLSEMETSVKEQLKPYRSHMEKSVYDSTYQNLLLKQLREQYAIPRLSLFYL